MNMKNNIVTIQFGSHLYGTNTTSSDLDYKSVHIPSAEDILLQRVSESVSSKRDKKEGEKNNPNDVDDESYSLQKYCKLAAQGQTVAIDMLFSPESSILETSKIWKYIQANKDQFLTKKSAAFIGYCRTQANKYGIKGSRVAAARDAAKAFQLMYENHNAVAKVGEFIPLMTALVKSNPEHTAFVSKEHKDGHMEDYFECCNRQVPFSASVKLAAEIYGKVYANYGDRARLAESNEGVDWKALSHAVRVGDEALELLNTGNITFPLLNAKHILDIKLGKLPYQQVAEEIEQLLSKVEEASEKSKLPNTVNQIFIDDLVMRVYGLQIDERYK